MALPQFTYRPLEFPDEIRLLYIEFTSVPPVGAIGKWSIKHVRLCEHPQYEALSYVWDQQPVLADGESAPTPPLSNLESALGYLNELAVRENRVFWIDALSIDQTNIEERNQQVAQMGSIYSQAKRVVAWIGVGNSAAGAAISKLSTYTDRRYTKQNLSEVDNQISLPFMLGVRALCRQKYWTRLWIIQELLLATDSELRWGNETCQWPKLCWFVQSLKDNFVPGASLKEEQTAYKISTINEITSSTAATLCKTWIGRQSTLRSDRLKPSSRSLMDLCLSFGGSNCKDPRDKVFGLLALADRCCRAKVIVDYSVALPELSRQMLDHCLMAHFGVVNSQNVVGVSHALHVTLQMTPADYSTQATQYLEQPPNEHFSVTGYAESHISIVIPMDVIVSPTDIMDLYIPSKCIERFLTIARLRNTYGEEQFHASFITRHATLASSSIETPSTLLRPSRLRGLLKLRLTHQMGASRDSERVAPLVRQLLFDARSVVPEIERGAISLALCDSGLICFVPRNTRCGDLICQFQSSTILVVIREKGIGRQQAHPRTGRAIDFLADPKDSPSILNTMDHNWQTTRQIEQDSRRVYFTLNVPALQALTCTSIEGSQAQKT